MHRRRLGQLLFGTAALGSGMVGVARAAPGLGGVETGARAPDFSLPGADGRRHALSDHAGRRVVLEWTSPVCPYTALKYRDGDMQAIQRRAAARGVVWLSVDTSAPGMPGYLTAAQARDRIARLGAKVDAFLFDETGAVGRAYGVRVTPTVVLIDRTGVVAYQGGIDEDPQLSRDTGADLLSRALADLAAGRPVAMPQTRAYGCALEYPLN